MSIIAPANEAIEWKITEWAHVDDAEGKYVGEPTPALEKAWEDIFDGTSSSCYSSKLVAY
jgi:hypothetical protein